MIHTLAWAASITAIFFLLLTSKFGVKYLLAVKGVIDAGWSSLSETGGFVLNTSRIVGAVVPILVLPKILYKAGGDFFSLPLSRVAVLFLMSNLIGTAMMIASGGFAGAVMYFLRVLNGFIGFYMFQVYFSDPKQYRKLLAALLLAGLFPMGMGLYGAVTGTVFGEVRRAAGLVRNIGVYHDAVVIRIYAFQTLAAVLLYWENYRPQMLKRMFLAGYAAVCTIIIFKTYSKSALLILVAWTVIWIVFKKKIGLLFLLPFILLIANFVMDNALVDQVEQVFSKETAAWSGEMSESFRFSGRVPIWQDYLEMWRQSDFLNQLFGIGKSPPAHNEFLRILLTNGIMGLAVYIFIYLYIGLRVAIGLLKERSSLSVMAVMLFTMLTIDNIGITPGMYPAYQWFVYGFITLSLRQVDVDNSGDRVV